MIARRLGTQGSPTMAVHSTRAVSFVGRSWQAANLALISAVSRRPCIVTWGQQIDAQSQTEQSDGDGTGSDIAFMCRSAADGIARR